MNYPRFRRRIIDRRLVTPHSRIVAGVSGGMDSMVLLGLLLRAAKELKLQIGVAHVNYMLRGKDSDKDEALVRRVCAQYGVPCNVLKKRPVAGANLQDSARRLRYDFFADTAKKTGAGTIAIAHHMDDQAETILLHLIRGAGIKGLSGMREVSEFKNFKIVRPLLSFTKDEIGAYAKKEHVEFREDKSNSTSKYMRNTLRHSIMPLLCKINPRIARSLAQTAVTLAEDDVALAAISKEAFDQALSCGRDGRVTLSRESYIHLPVAIRRRALLAAFERVAGGTHDLNADQLKRMDEISCGSKNGSYRLPKACKFTREGSHLTIRRMGTKADR